MFCCQVTRGWQCTRAKTSPHDVNLFLVAGAEPDERSLETNEARRAGSNHLHSRPTNETQVCQPLGTHAARSNLADGTMVPAHQAAKWYDAVHTNSRLAARETSTCPRN